MRSRGEVLTEIGLTDQHIARQITGWVAALGTSLRNPSQRTLRLSATGWTRSTPKLGSWTLISSDGWPPGSTSTTSASTSSTEWQGPIGAAPAAADSRYPFNSFDWDPIWATLAERFTVIAPDMIGHGLLRETRGLRILGG